MKKEKIWKPFLSFYTRFHIPWLFYILSAILGIIYAEMVLYIAKITIQVNKGELYNSVIIGYSLLSVINAIIGGLRAQFNEYGNLIVTLRSQEMLWKKILHLSQEDIDREKPSELISCITNDLAQASRALSQIFLAISSIYAFVRACMVLYNYNSTIACYMLLVLPLTVVVFFLVGRIEYTIFLKRYDALNVMTSWFSEHLAAAKYVKVQTLEEEEIKNGFIAIDSRYHADVYYAFMQQVQVLMNAISTKIEMVIMAIFGSNLIREKKLEASGINASSTYMEKIDQYKAELLTGYQVIKATQGSLKRVNHILDLSDEEQENRKKVDDLSGDIVFDHVKFGYDKEQPILKDVSFTIPKGKNTAIVGSNGCGKSTVLKLMQCFYQPCEGNITINGCSLKDIDYNQVRSQFSYVLQNTPLFSGTIRENITYGVKGDVDEKEVIEAAKQADIHDYIMNLPEGYDTPVKELGTNLSGGQRQRIAIARALIVKPEYLVFDEATASLDRSTGKKVMKNVLKNTSSVIYISHTMEEVQKADYVIVLKDGFVEACGTPEEIAVSSETYKAFLGKQKSKEEVK